MKYERANTGTAASQVKVLVCLSFVGAGTNKKCRDDLVANFIVLVEAQLLERYDQSSIHRLARQCRTWWSGARMAFKMFGQCLNGIVSERCICGTRLKRASLGRAVYLSKRSFTCYPVVFHMANSVSFPPFWPCEFAVKLTCLYKLSPSLVAASLRVLACSD